MDYVQIDQSIRKPVLDTLLTTEALSRVPYPNMNGVNGGYRALSIPIFPSSKSASAPLTSTQPGGTGSSSELPARSGGLHAYLPPQPLNGAHYSHLVKGGTGALGMVQLNKPGDLLGSLMGDGVADRGKKTREGGRGSRGGGSRKRSRTGPVEDGGPRNPVDGSGVPVTTPPARGSNGGRQRTNAGDKTEKNSCRKQNSQASRRGDKKSTQFAAPSAPDVLPKIGALSLSSNAPRSGLFDIYGLKTKPVDISHHVTDLSLSELVIRSSQPVVKPDKAPEPQKADGEIPFDQEISQLLAFLPPFNNRQSSSGAEAVSSKGGDSALFLKSAGKGRPQRLLFDLESPVQAQVNESFTRMMDPILEEQSNQGDRDAISASPVGEHNNGLEEGCSLELSQKALTQSDRGFVVEDLKLYSVEEFMTRLQLAPSSDSLCSLMSQVSYQGDFALPGGYSPAIESRTRSIPPQPYSYPSTGIIRFEADFERSSKLGKTGNRPWRRCEVSGRDGNQQNGYGVAGPVDLGELGVGNGISEKDLETAGFRLQDSGTASPGNEQFLSFQDQRTAERADLDQQASMPQGEARIALPMEVEGREGVSNEAGDVAVHDATRQDRNQDDRVVCKGEAALPHRDAPGVPPVSNCSNLAKMEQDSQDMIADDQAGGIGGSRLGDANLGVTSAVVLQSGEVDRPCSPRVELAASILMDMFKSTEQYECPPVVSRRRSFQSYPGAPTQRTTKSMKIGQLVGGTSVASGQGYGESRDGLDGGNVPPSKALVSEKRKSLSQVTETAVGMSKAAPPLPSRGTACGLRGSVGASGGRVNGWAKGINKVTGRTAASPPAAAGPSKGFNSPPGAVKGALRTKLCKGAVAAKTPTPQKVGTAKTSKASLGAMSPHSLVAVTGPQPSSVKSNRHSLPLSSEGKKTKGKAGSKD